MKAKWLAHCSWSYSEFLTCEKEISLLWLTLFFTCLVKIKFNLEARNRRKCKYFGIESLLYVTKCCVRIFQSQEFGDRDGCVQNYDQWESGAKMISHSTITLPVFCNNLGILSMILYSVGNGWTPLLWIIGFSIYPPFTFFLVFLFLSLLPSLLLFPSLLPFSFLTVSFPSFFSSLPFSFSFSFPSILPSFPPSLLSSLPPSLLSTCLQLGNIYSGHSVYKALCTLANHFKYSDE